MEPHQEIVVTRTGQTRIEILTAEPGTKAQDRGPAGGREVSERINLSAAAVRAMMQAG